MASNSSLNGTEDSNPSDQRNELDGKHESTMKLSASGAMDLEMADQVLAINIPRPDGGKDAWLFLAGCFFFEALVWGFPFSFGVFEAFNTSHLPFSDHPDGIAIIGTCSTGVILISPVTPYALEAWPAFRRRSSILGLFLTTTALIASSFSTAVWHLITTQGILYAVGGSLLYVPTVFYLDEWFMKRKGLAFGIMWAGVGESPLFFNLPNHLTMPGTSGLIFPFLLSFLLNKYSFRTTLRVWALVLLTLCTPLIYYVKPRLPASATIRKPFSYEFLKTRTFLALQTANIVESLGFFLPAIYIPSYAKSIELSSLSSTILLALLNSSSVIGAISLGHLCDRLPVITVIAISTLGSTLSVFLFWGLSSSLPLLVIFSTTYGVFAGGFSAIWTGMYKEVRKQSPEVGLAVIGMFSGGRGVGSVLGGPISEVVLRAGDFEGVRGAYGGVYGPVVVFTWISALCGVASLGAWERRK